MIQFTNVEFTYPDHTFGLTIQNLSIIDGERVAIVGPSGSGKTTLVKLMSGALIQQRGTIISCDTKLTNLNDRALRQFRLKRIGFVFQEFALLDYLNVRDNILLPCRLGAEPMSPEARDRAEALARSVGLHRHLDRYPQKLSFGERQRVAICRAIVTSPSIVLADEPTGNLDGTTADEVISILDDCVQQSGATLIVVTHNLELTNRFDRTIDVSEFAAAYT